jgi:hypothetical protein
MITADNPPKLHRVGGELSARWKLQDEDVKYLTATIRPGMRTLETGAGLSTIVFALKGAEHTCVVPDEELVDRIRDFCRSAKIPIARLEFVVERSEDALPRLPRQVYEFVLLDGRHGFPAPFIDCYYAARLLKVGGYVMLDDLHIWTIDLLVQYLRSENSWDLVRETWHSAVFVKRDDDALAAEWTQQPFVTGRSLPGSLRAKRRLVQRMIRTRDVTPLRIILGRRQKRSTGDEPRQLGE